MRRNGLLLFVIACAALLATGRVGTLSAAGGSAVGPRLTAISSTSGTARAALLIEASEPVAYATVRPDPLTVVVDLRGATSAGFANGFSADPRSPISRVAVEDARDAEGRALARVRVSLREAIAHRVRSQRNLIFVELDTPAAAIATPAPAIGRSAEADAPATATVLRAVKTTTGAEGTSIILVGNGTLESSAVQNAGPTRLFLDFPGVSPSAPATTSVKQGPVERVRVAVNSREPLVTRVVVDLNREAAYRMEPAGRELKLFFPAGEGASAAPAADARAARATAKAEAAPKASADATPAPPRAGPASAAPVPAKAAAPQALAAVAPPAPVPGSLTQSPGGQQRTYSGHPITLDFQGADLRAVLRTFAEISGLNIVIDPTVQGTVDVALKDVPWDQALDIVLKANKLGYSVDGTIVRVAPLSVLADEEKQRRRLTEEQALSGELRVVTAALSYATAEDVRPLLLKSALSQRGTVEVDARTNTLIISDLQPSLDKATALLASIDRPQPQVEIEARIITTTRDFARRIGVEWGVNGRATQELANTLPFAFPNQAQVLGATGGITGPVNNPAPTAVALGVPAATSAIGLALGAINGSFNLDVALSALERSGNGKVLSTPRVSTQNNVEAEIMQGIQIPIQTVANNTVTVTFKDAALTLRVTPQITNAGTVIMKIAVENSSPDFSRAVGESQIPPIDTQRALTKVLVKDGDTTVIGGIYVNRTQTVQDRVPSLHRIPLLGWLFKRDAVEDESRELLIFITPRILKS
jgi:type IV pilus secretin PilQ/predicted competence protein